MPGRCEVLQTDIPFTVIIDYAHSPDAIRNILMCVHTFTKGRIITLFGCGGDRERGKRPLMTQTAAEYSDYVVITSDNPRTEEPNKIIEDILPGMISSDTPYVTIPERTHAIAYALKTAKADDAFVLCGKGHETYQIIGTEKIHYDEREIVCDLLKKTGYNKNHR